MPVIRDKIMELFSIKTIDIYTSIGGKLESFFEEELMDRRGKKGVIKVSGRDQTDFLSPELMYSNYKKLDKFYEKNMGPEDLDERIFFKERLANLTPSKFTPFARQGYANRGRKTTHN